LRPGDNRWRERMRDSADESGPERRVGAFHEYYIVSYYIQRRRGIACKWFAFPFRGADSEAPAGSGSFAHSRARAGRRKFAESIHRSWAHSKNVLVLARPVAAVQNVPAS